MINFTKYIIVINAIKLQIQTPFHFDQIIKERVQMDNQWRAPSHAIGSVEISSPKIMQTCGPNPFTKES